MLIKNIQIVIITLLFIVIPVNAANEVCYYKFEDGGPHADRLDRVFDYTLNNHDGYAFNVSNYVAGYYGACIEYDNGYTYIAIPDHADFSFSNGVEDYGFSISFWVKSSTFENTLFCGKGTWLPSHEYAFYTGVNGNIYFYMKDSSFIHGSFRKGVTRNTLEGYTDEWLFLTVTHDPSDEIQIFVNSEKWDIDNAVGENYSAMDNGIGNFTIGQSNSFNNSVMIDEFILWDNYLSHLEITALYQSYFNESYSIILLNKELNNKNKNISIYENNEFIGTYKYGDIINITNMRTYNFIIQEDIYDDIAHIENIDLIAKNNVSSIAYILIIFMIIGLIIYFVRR